MKLPAELKGVNLIITGPPLAGKSTLAAALMEQMPYRYFSVRKFFEPLRVQDPLSLPGLGAFLDDEQVITAAAHTIRFDDLTESFILDGFPGNGTQAAWLRSLVEKNDIKGGIIHLDINEAEGYRRMLQRQVCHTCDGGVDQATGTDGLCAACGSKLSRRGDDTAEGYAQRLASYREREKSVKEELINFKGWSHHTIR